MAIKGMPNDALKCHHCHTRGYMDLIDKVHRDIAEPLFHDEENPQYVNIGQESWRILECPNCRETTIQHRISDNRWGEETDEIIYPQPVTYKAPHKINALLRAAIEVAYIDPAAAVVNFRVILEMIWIDQMPPGTQKPLLRGDTGIIRQLVDARILAGDYAEMADVLANIGNAGSHSDKSVITHKDAAMARELCEAILEHVYQILPTGRNLVEKLERKFPRTSGWRDGKFVDKNNW